MDAGEGIKRGGVEKLLNLPAPSSIITGNKITKERLINTATWQRVKCWGKMDRAREGRGRGKGEYTHTATHTHTHTHTATPLHCSS